MFKNTILHTQNLTIGYPNQIVATDINIAIKKGEFVALLGRNGAGKSTLLKTLTKVLPKIEGSIFIKNNKLTSINHLEKAKIISLVLTERLPESQLTVFELVALGRQPYTNWLDKLSKKDVLKINWALEQTAVKHLKNKPFYELSDGQLQRVLIARALAQDTELIILDEPTVHLDLHHTFKIFSLLKKLAFTTKKTILISTHQVNLAIQLADKLLLLSEKKITSGTSKELIEKQAFNSLFPEELIYFNKKLQQFIIKKI